jgi:hypothetical protein
MDPGLRYLSAAEVESPVGRLQDLALLSPSGVRLGSIDGVLVDLDEQRVTCLVVNAVGWLTWFRPRHRYVVPIDPARFDVKGQAVRLDVEPRELRACVPFHLDAFPSVSSDELAGIAPDQRAA